MPYRLTAEDATVEDGLCRIAGEQVDRAIAEIDDPSVGRHETVHQVRKRCKKLRGLVRLVRPAFDGYRRENRFFRDAARPLSAVRDQQAMAEAYDALTAVYEDQIDRTAFASIRRRLTVRGRRGPAGDAGLDERLAEIRQRMVEARDRVAGWRLDADGFDAVAGGLGKTYARAVDAMADARKAPRSATLHAWRKRAKHHWYHARLLTDLWPAVIRPHRDAADALCALLGDDHDLAVLRETVVGAPDRLGSRRDVEAFVALIDRRRAVLQHQAFAEGRRLFAETPKALASRWGGYWEARTAAGDPLRPLAMQAAS